MAKLTPLKAIRKKCLDCCADSPAEVRRCEIFGCPLWEYRMGHRPPKEDHEGEPRQVVTRSINDPVDLQGEQRGRVRGRRRPGGLSRGDQCAGGSDLLICNQEGGHKP